MLFLDYSTYLHSSVINFVRAVFWLQIQETAYLLAAQMVSQGFSTETSDEVGIGTYTVQ